MSPTSALPDRLLEEVAAIFDAQEQAVIKHALSLATAAHAEQARGTGEPYVHHSIEVARILIEWGLAADVVAAALLHDVPEDTTVSLDRIRADFGDPIADLVEAVTKLSSIRLPKEDIDYEVENLRRLFFAMAEDLRVVLLKLADRLHNMRTIKGVPPEKRRRIGRETLEIFAPLADRLGMGEVQNELNDRGFRAADPTEYTWTKKQTEQLYNKSARYMTRVKYEFEETLEREGIAAQVASRTKNLYSLHRKLLQKERDIDRIYDFFAVRVVVPTIEECYQSMGVIHQHFKPLPHRIKDYIAVPKLNGYRSLHTTIFGPNNRLLEIQFRTEQMHREAEWGVAAHVVYAENKTSRLATADQLAVMRQLSSWQEELKDSPQEFDRFKLDLFSDRIFVFTPKGAPYSLPAGSTPVDFAYHVHTEVGDSCTGAKVNGVIVPLDARLANGDVVEILTQKNSLPKRDWLTFVRTGHARSAIRAHFRRDRREDHITAGREELEDTLKRHRTTLKDLRPEQLSALNDAAGAREFDDTLAAIGEGRYSVQAARRILGLEPSAARTTNKPVKETTVAVAGLQSLLTHRARCCHPEPPAAIIGYVTIGQGISIHRADCAQVRKLPDPARIIRVRWDD